MPDRAKRFLIGDTVAFTMSFLDRQSFCAKALPLARGKVTALHTLDRVTLADVEWDTPGMPKRINVKNLIGVATGEGGLSPSPGGRLP